MIEWIETPSGEKVIRCDGHLLASRYDPLLEASDWLSRRRTFLRSVRTAFILGAGSGFHIAEVARTTEARLVVIEINEELRSAVQEKLKELSPRLIWAKAKCARDLRSEECVRAALENSFVVLEHPASVRLDAAAYREIGTFLRARDWGPLNWQWQLKKLAPFDPQPKMQASAQPLTICDLDDSELVRNGAERERLLLQALRELVK